jgi:hypothetical protein
MAKRLLPYGLLLLLLLAMVPLKARFDYDIGPRVYDGDYFYGIARSVAEGRGLKSNLSLYFQGFQSFPHRVTTSPLWPLALGYTGRVFDLRTAATALPEALYFVDLLLLYFLGYRLWRRIAGDRPGWMFREGWVPDFGHVAVFVLATNVIFFRFSSVPNNEPLAFCFLFSLLIALDRAALHRSVAWAGAAGLLGGLTLLTRVQTLGIVVALPFVLAWVGIGDRRSFRLAAAALLGILVPMIPWVLYLASWTVRLTLPNVLGLDTQRETPALAVFDHTVATPTFWAYVQDRATGLRVAFDPRTRYSYVFHFSALAYAVPLALLHAGQRLMRGKLVVPWGLPARHALPAAALVGGVGMLLPVHHSHSTFAEEWLFGYRHGLPLLFLVLPSLAYLDAHASRIWRLAAAGLLAATLVMNAVGMKTLLGKHYTTGLDRTELELVTWLDSRSPRPAVVTTKSFPLAAFSRSGYHWILCNHPPTQTLRLLREAGADYLVVYPRDRGCNFIRGLFPRNLRIVKSFGETALYVMALRDQPRAGSRGRARPGVPMRQR